MMKQSKLCFSAARLRVSVQIGSLVIVSYQHYQSYDFQGKVTQWQALKVYRKRHSSLWWCLWWSYRGNSELLVHSDSDMFTSNALKQETASFSLSSFSSVIWFRWRFRLLLVNSSCCSLYWDSCRFCSNSTWETRRHTHTHTHTHTIQTLDFYSSHIGEIHLWQ